MAFSSANDYYLSELKLIAESGLFKTERLLHSPQGADIHVEFPARAPVQSVINFCANNYLGLSSHSKVLWAARRGLMRRGYGMSSVRFICGTQDIHRELEQKISTFLGMDDAILYTSCFDANGGIFEALLGENDAIISDTLNHASIIDGIRLSKARRFRYSHSDMNDLADKLKETRHSRLRLIATDGVFSMDGDIARLPEICTLAEKYDAMVFVDDSHATGFMGRTGRGVHEYWGVMDKVDIINSTLGKALGGASGGFTTARQPIVDLLRQRSRPYLFSNSVSPIIVSASLAVIEMLSETTELRDHLEQNTKYFRKGMAESGFITKGETPIVPIMLYNAKLAQKFAADLFEEGIYVIGFCYPVVPKGQARIRVQISAVHETDDLEHAIKAFRKIAEKYEILGLSEDQIIEKYGA